MGQAKQWDLGKVFETIETAGNPYATVLLAASLLDDFLLQLLESRMIESATTQKLLRDAEVLGSFSAKIDLAYALALIPEEVFLDLNLIRKVRNDFAHSLDHGLGFATPSVADRIAALQIEKVLGGVLPTFRILKADVSNPSDVSRVKLITAVGMLAEVLWYRTYMSRRPYAQPATHGLAPKGTIPY